MQTMEIRMTGADSRLWGVGRAQDGRAVFVRGALPGELVRARVTREKERYLEAAVDGVLEPSPDRAVPACPAFGECGGCAALHMRYEATLRLKRDAVKSALLRIGGLPDADVRETLGAPSPTGYRGKAEYAFARAEDGSVTPGFFAASSAKVVPCGRCLLQRDAANDCALAVSRTPPARFWGGRLVTRVNRAGESMAVLCAQGAFPDVPAALLRSLRAVEGFRSLHVLALKPRAAHALDGESRLVWGDEALSEALLGLQYRMSPKSFFQVNPDQAEVLYQCALDAAALEGDEDVLDAYCGVGTISLTLAQRARRVTGVEIVPDAVRDARENARRNGLEQKARFVLGDAGEAMRAARYDVAVVDPPRKGLDDGLVKSLVASPPKRLVYVSCNPATLARDAARLAPAFRAEYFQPVDMFCWTEHVETVCLFTRS